MFLLLRCNLFEPRSPELPIQPSTAYPPAFTPSALIDNFQRALTERAVSQYLNCFVPSEDSLPYQFVPAADAIARFSELFQQWSIDNEQQFLVNFAALTTTTSPQFLFYQTQLEQSTADSAVFHAQYVLYPNIRNESFPDSSVGRIRLHCIRASNGQWYIHRWFDQQQEAEVASFSMIKALLVR